MLAGGWHSALRTLAGFAPGLSPSPHPQRAAGCSGAGVTAPPLACRQRESRGVIAKCTPRAWTAWRAPAVARTLAGWTGVSGCAVRPGRALTRVAFRSGFAVAP